MMNHSNKQQLTGSHLPMSPVCSHPSLSRASAVFSGSFKYPWNTFGPFTHTWSREEDRLRSLFYDIIKGCCLSELEKKVQQLWHWTPHLSFTVDWQVIHFCHIHQFDGVTGQRRSNVTCRQMISVQVISIHWNWHKKKTPKGAAVPAVQSPGIDIVHPAVHSVWP